MKKACLLLFAFVCFALASKAQDVITLTNGTQIQAKVLQINPADIVYKDYNNQDGPTITLLKAGVVSIVYANGTRTVFSDADRASSGSFTRSSNNNNRYNNRNNNNDQVYKRKPGNNSRVKGWYFGANVNLGAGNATNNDPTYSTSAGDYSGVNILATRMFTQHLGLQFGIGSENWDYNVSNNATSYYPYTTDVFSLNCLTIPVHVLYFSNAKKRVGLYVTAGIDFSFVAGARDQEQDDLSSYYSAFVISPIIGAGVEFRNRSARGIWMFGPFYKASVTNAYSGSGGDTWMNGSNTGMLSSGGISISYMGKFGR